MGSLTQSVKDIMKEIRGKKEKSVYSESSDEDRKMYESVSSDDELSDQASETEPLSKKRKIDEGTDETSCSKNLKKLKAVESQFSKQEQYAPAVHEVVAATVNKGLSEPVDHASNAVQDLVTKYNRPENCEFLSVPKVNRMLWTGKQTTASLKKGDRLLQRTQTYLTKGMAPLIAIMNKTLAMESEDAEEIFDLSLDAFNLLAYTHRDFSSHRRRLLQPAIAPRYTSLCKESEKFASATHLFGDDSELEKRLKDIEDSQKLTKNLTVLPHGKPIRHAKSSPAWVPRDQQRPRTSNQSHDFLGRRALGQRPSYHLHQNRRKNSQGLKMKPNYNKQ